ncbi:12173_t:CDS:2 [Gigaspora margarita]|uniref:12173_t:CDS:1 n=1 Tax=Gigaspora margarita TaxID=4874 RepID=A0ABN7VVB6_GIGMA|nr:12173_t:CDS:2 [Gigaspora margarita]
MLHGNLQALITHIYGDLGTRQNNHQYILECAILTTKNWIITGFCTGQRAFISYINLKPSNTELLFKLRRHQFLIKLAFALTINKAQDQTISKLELYLADPVFTHSQLYVALSQVRSCQDIKIVAENSRIANQKGYYMANIVFREIFD